MDKVKAIVDRQIDEGHIDVAALAQEMCMSTTTFRRRFTAVVQEKPQAYLMRLRMEKARLLLDTHPLSNLRVNVNAQMFDPIYDKLGVAEGDAMYLAPNERINILGPNA